MKKTLVAGLGVAAGIAARPLLNAVLRSKFRRDVARLNGGDYTSLLAGYADDAVLIFNGGPHRWAGAHHGRFEGKAAIESFLQNFAGAQVQGEIIEFWTAGPPWALTLIARFDDHAEAPDGTRLYENQAVIVLKTRLGKVVEHRDFWVDTQRIVDFDRALSTYAP